MHWINLSVLLTNCWRARRAGTFVCKAMPVHALQLGAFVVRILSTHVGIGIRFFAKEKCRPRHSGSNPSAGNRLTVSRGEPVDRYSVNLVGVAGFSPVSNCLGCDDCLSPMAGLVALICVK